MHQSTENKMADSQEEAAGILESSATSDSKPREPNNNEEKVRETIQNEISLSEQEDDSSNGYSDHHTCHHHCMAKDLKEEPISSHVAHSNVGHATGSSDGSKITKKPLSQCASLPSLSANRSSYNRRSIPPPISVVPPDSQDRINSDAVNNFGAVIDFANSSPTFLTMASAPDTPLPDREKTTAVASASTSSLTSISEIPLSVAPNYSASTSAASSNLGSTNASVSAFADFVELQDAGALCNNLPGNKGTTNIRNALLAGLPSSNDQTIPSPSTSAGSSLSLIPSITSNSGSDLDIIQDLNVTGTLCSFCSACSACSKLAASVPSTATAKNPTEPNTHSSASAESSSNADLLMVSDSTSVGLYTGYEPLKESPSIQQISSSPSANTVEYLPETSAPLADTSKINTGQPTQHTKVTDFIPAHSEKQEKASKDSTTGNDLPTELESSSATDCMPTTSVKTKNSIPTDCSPKEITTCPSASTSTPAVSSKSSKATATTSKSSDRSAVPSTSKGISEAAESSTISKDWYSSINWSMTRKWCTKIDSSKSKDKSKSNIFSFPDNWTAETARQRPVLPKNVRPRSRTTPRYRSVSSHPATSSRSSIVIEDDKHWIILDSDTDEEEYYHVVVRSRSPSKWSYVVARSVGGNPPAASGKQTISPKPTSSRTVKKKHPPSPLKDYRPLSPMVSASNFLVRITELKIKDKSKEVKSRERERAPSRQGSYEEVKLTGEPKPGPSRIVVTPPSRSLSTPPLVCDEPEERPEKEGKFMFKLSVPKAQVLVASPWHYLSHRCSPIPGSGASSPQSVRADSAQASRLSESRPPSPVPVVKASQKSPPPKPKPEKENE